MLISFNTDYNGYQQLVLLTLEKFEKTWDHTGQKAVGANLINLFHAAILAVHVHSYRARSNEWSWVRLD